MFGKRNFIAFLFAFLASFCILFHLISFSNYDFKSLATCLDGGLIRVRSEGGLRGGDGGGIDDNFLVHDYLVSSSTSSSSPGEIVDSNQYHQHILLHHHRTSSSGNIHFPRTRRRLPSCIIIGVRKGATRALLEFLNLHPSVQKVSDEVHFFNDDVKYGYGLDWYRKQMPYSFPDQVTIEKTPAYFITDSVPSRIYSMNSSIKLILIVRDPVTRLISDYAQLAENKAKRVRMAVASFEQMALQSNGAVNIAYKPIRTSLYSVYYSRWLQLFPSSQLHVVDGDRLVYDPFFEVQKVETFLGLEHKIGRDHFIYNSTKGFYCVRINGTLEKCLNESKGRPHPTVNPKVIKILRRFYRPYNYQFYKMTGKNFNWPEV